MVIKLRLEVFDPYRRQINWRAGRKGKAKRLEVLCHIHRLIDSDMQTSQYEFDHDPDVRKKRARKIVREKMSAKRAALVSV